MDLCEALCEITIFTISSELLQLMGLPPRWQGAIPHNSFLQTAVLFIYLTLFAKQLSIRKWKTSPVLYVALVREVKD